MEWKTPWPPGHSTCDASDCLFWSHRWSWCCLKNSLGVSSGSCHWSNCDSQILKIVMEWIAFPFILIWSKRPISQGSNSKIMLNPHRKAILSIRFIVSLGHSICQERRDKHCLYEPQRSSSDQGKQAASGVEMGVTFLIEALITMSNRWSFYSGTLLCLSYYENCWSVYPVCCLETPILFGQTQMSDLTWYFTVHTVHAQICLHHRREFPLHRRPQPQCIDSCWFTDWLAELEQGPKPKPTVLCGHALDPRYILPYCLRRNYISKSETNVQIHGYVTQSKKLWGSIGTAKLFAGHLERILVKCVLKFAGTCSGGNKLQHRPSCLLSMEISWLSRNIHKCYLFFRWKMTSVIDIVQ